MDSSTPSTSTEAASPPRRAPKPSRKKPSNLQPIAVPYRSLQPALNSNSSTYTLETFPSDDALENSSLLNTTAQSPSRLESARRSPRHAKRRSAKRELFLAAVKMGGLFIAVSILLGGTLYLALPKLDSEDKDKLRIPKSFDDLKTLNSLLQKYRVNYPYRILLCWVCTYLYLQAFSLPGSMYLSILAGAVWGVVRAVPLVCTSVATGASLCYLISAVLGPALLTLPTWKVRLDAWKQKVESQKEHLFSFLIIIRIAPLPPHWVVNVIAPHVGVRLPIFWLSAFAGIFGVTLIHVTIGGGLDEMTSADDFHLISWRNFLGLSAIVVAAALPVVLRRVFAKEEEAALEVEEVEATPNVLVLLSDSENESGSDSEDTDTDEVQRVRGAG